MQADERTRVKHRLNRIAGQVAGLQKMVDDDRYCVDVLTQVAAIRSALDALGVELLARHMAHCMVGHGRGEESPGGAQPHPEARGRSAEELIEEMRVSLSRFIR
jgi:DNA-binding FrmR family transcriptional regulator